MGGTKVDAIIGDAASSGKENLKLTSRQNIKIVPKLNPSVTQGFRKDEDRFDYNKDADRFVCPAGHKAMRKARQGKKILEGIKCIPIILMWRNVRLALSMMDVINPEQKPKRIPCP